jgi:hypothetical protein
MESGPYPAPEREEARLTPASWVPLGVAATVVVFVVGASVTVTQWATRLENQLVNISIQIEEVKRNAALPKDRYTCSDHIRFVERLALLNPRLQLPNPSSDCSVRDIP